MNDFSMSHDPPAGGEINVRSPYYFIARTQDTCGHCGASMELFALVVPPSHETLDVGEDEVTRPLDCREGEVTHAPDVGECEIERVPDIEKGEVTRVPDVGECQVANVPDGWECGVTNVTDDGNDEVTRAPDVGNDVVANAPDDGVAAGRWVSADHHALLFHIESLSPGVQARLASFTRSFHPERRDPEAVATWANHCAACGSWLDDDTLFCEPGEAFCPIEEAAIARIRWLRIEEAFEAAAGGYSVDPNFMPATSLG